MATLTCGAGGSTGSEVVTQINANTTAIAGHTTTIGGHTTSIDALDTRVDILEPKVAALEAAPLFLYDKAASVLDMPETYTVLNEINESLVKAGVYTINSSSVYTFDDTTHSVYSRFTVNGVSQEVISEPKDVTDRVTTSYGFVREHTADGPLHVTTEVRKETAGSGVLNIIYGNLWVDFKREL